MASSKGIVFAAIVDVINDNRDKMEPDEMISSLLGTAAFFATVAGYSKDEILKHVEETIDHKELISALIDSAGKPVAQA